MERHACEYCITDNYENYECIINDDLILLSVNFVQLRSKLSTAVLY